MAARTEISPPRGRVTGKRWNPINVRNPLLKRLRKNVQYKFGRTAEKENPPRRHNLIEWTFPLCSFFSQCTPFLRISFHSIFFSTIVFVFFCYHSDRHDGFDGSDIYANRRRVNLDALPTWKCLNGVTSLLLMFNATDRRRNPHSISLGRTHLIWSSSESASITTIIKKITSENRDRSFVSKTKWDGKRLFPPSFNPSLDTCSCCCFEHLKKRFVLIQITFHSVEHLIKFFSFPDWVVGE